MWKNRQEADNDFNLDNIIRNQDILFQAQKNVLNRSSN